MKTKISLLFLLLVSFGVLAKFTIIPKYKEALLEAKIASYQSIKDYKTLWFKADSLQNIGQPKSALKVVEIIYTKAKKENNSPQFLKAVLVKISLESHIEENYLVKSIAYLHKEIKSSSGARKAILQSALAEQYFRYYTKNQWKIQQRSNTTNFDKTDIETWTVKDIIEAAIKFYNASLSNPAQLKKIPIHNYSLILKHKSLSEQYRPTLYDLLGHRAIDFYRNTISGLNRPADQFTLNKEEYLMPWNEFVKLPIETADSMSSDFYGIKVLQDLLAFHGQDSKPTALIDLDLIRLDFVKNRSSNRYKDSLYFQSLLYLENRYADFPTSTQVTYKIAERIFAEGQKYNRYQPDAHQWDKKRAIEYCRNAIKKFPNSEGSQNCKILISKIKKKGLSVANEYANYPNLPFRALITQQNVPKIYLRIIKMDPEKYKKIMASNSRSKRYGALVKFTPLKTWSVDMQDQGDYQRHAMEIKMPELPFGFYVVLIDHNKEYSAAKSIGIQSPFWITNLSYIKTQNDDNSFDIYMLHRQSGQPIKGVNISCFSEYYDYKKSKRVEEKAGNYVSDAKGYFHISNHTKNYSKTLTLKFSHGEDYFIPQDYLRQYKVNVNGHRKSINTRFFLDRAIYRPGQTIYFKGIMLQYMDDSVSILANHSTKVTLYDHNFQKVKELELVTNEYGSFNGQFIAPNNGITGNMTIRGYHGNISFSVEEYKRPKFEVEFLPISGSYKLGEKVTVKGKAKAYAGNNIDGAKVKYRIVRSATFPYWGYWWRWSRPTSSTTEIKNGEILTDENGEFEVEFIALEDKSVARKMMPVFNYQIYADVTDINGETHSSEKSVSVGTRALILKTNVPKEIDLSQAYNISITTTNLNGEFLPTKGEIKIHRLNKPDRVFRKRMWGEPDLFSMTKEEYYATFPHDEYSNENNIYNWPKESWGYSYTFDTGKNKKLDLSRILAEKPGSFVLEISAKDAFGQLVESKAFFTTYSSTAKTISSNTVDWFQPLKTKAEPGENVSFLIGTAEENQILFFEVESQGKIVDHQWIKLSNEQKTISIPVKEAYRGNFYYHINFVKNNRFYSHRQKVVVPFTNKKLDIEIETFRDKLQPNEKEEWKIKIKGKDGDKVAAELLATMYDASLDAFRANNWNFSLYGSYYSQHSITTAAFNTAGDYWRYYNSHINYKTHNYNNLNWFGFDYYGYYRVRYQPKSYNVSGNAGVDVEMDMEEGDVNDAPAELAKEEVLYDIVSKNEDKKLNNNAVVADSVQFNGTYKWGTTPAVATPQIRTNFSETAFFFPDLQTDAEGNIILKFTAPESLTRWKIMGLAHTKDLKYGQLRKELVTQKDLMVVPNAPRFFREGDKITFSAKISNLSERDLSGTAKLLLFDALTMQPLDVNVNRTSSELPFSVEAGKSSLATWNLSIPEGIEAITYRITATAGNFSDGEEMTVPVLTNRMMVTETMPLPINGFQTKKFTFTKLVNSSSSSTLKSHRLTLEFTSHPAWYAVQALPYLMEFPYECLEQTFSRYYANSLASHIVNSSPKIKAVFDKWKNINPEALKSNLEKNQELKALLLEETPWVLQAQNESERKKRIGLLFDLNTMTKQLKTAEQKLKQNQLNDGSWPWFRGGYGSRYITQHIVTGFGHLDHLGVKEIKRNTEVRKMLRKAVSYLDNKIREDYDYMMKHYPENKDKMHISQYQIQYLYARSYFVTDFSMSKRNKVAFDYYFNQAKKYWLSQSQYMQGMIALALHRYDEKTIPDLIIKSLKEHALHSEEMGMYWKSSHGWYWYQAPIETQALLIEAFDEVVNDKKAVEDMKVWLLKQKQTQDWKTTKATAEACYALLLRGSNLLASDELVEVKIGNQEISAKTLQNDEIEAGTGYYKKSWNAKEITPNMGNITVTKKDEGVAWGGVYWQYFEQLDKITFAKTPLAIDKKLFVEKMTSSGPVIVPVTDTTKLKVGDKIKVRIVLRVDRAMDYVHMKDMRASALEPTNVISTYKWQDGLGYYQSTRDAATNFFFDHLGKGTYVFEYSLFVTHKGDFSNGITTIQCMYAPEFTSHSEGVRIRVE